MSVRLSQILSVALIAGILGYVVQLSDGVVSPGGSRAVLSGGNAPVGVHRVRAASPNANGQVRQSGARRTGTDAASLERLRAIHEAAAGESGGGRVFSRARPALVGPNGEPKLPVGGSKVVPPARETRVVPSPAPAATSTEQRTAVVPSSAKSVVNTGASGAKAKRRLRHKRRSGGRRKWRRGSRSQRRCRGRRCRYSRRSVRRPRARRR